MKILILGGTGVIGSYLVNILKKKGFDEITVTSRTRFGVFENIKYVKGDAQDLIFLKSILALNKWTAIIDFMNYSTLSFNKRAKQLLEATDQYIFISSSRVYADSKVPLTEKSPRLLDISKDQNYLSTDDYALSKARQEDILFSSKLSNWTIVRPYITFGFNRLQLGALEKEDWLFRSLKGRSIVFTKNISACVTTITYGDDVAKGIISIIGKDKTLGEVFQITSPKSLKWSSILDCYTKVIEEYHSTMPKVKMVELNTFIKIHPQKFQIIYDRIYNRVFDCKKIHQFIDTDKFKDPIEMLNNCMKSFIKKPNFNLISGKLEARRDCLTNEKTPLNDFFTFKQKLGYILYRLKILS